MKKDNLEKVTNRENIKWMDYFPPIILGDLSNITVSETVDEEMRNEW